jgi:hypothetical protein
VAVFIIAIALLIHAHQLATAARMQQRAEGLVVPPRKKHFQKPHHLNSILHQPTLAHFGPKNILES